MMSCNRLKNSLCHNIRSVITCLLLISSSAAFSSTGTDQTRFDGTGQSYELAIRDALVKALNATGSAVVHSELTVKNGVITSDEVKLMSKGVIDRYTVHDVVSQDGVFTLFVETSPPTTIPVQPSTKKQFLSYDSFHEAIAKHEQTKQVSQSFHSIYQDDISWLHDFYNFELTGSDVLSVDAQGVASMLAYLKVSINSDLYKSFLSYVHFLDSDPAGIPTGSFVSKPGHKTFVRSVGPKLAQSDISLLPSIMEVQVSFLGTSLTLLLYDNLVISSPVKDLRDSKHHGVLVPKLRADTAYLSTSLGEHFFLHSQPLTMSKRDFLTDNACYMSLAERQPFYYYRKQCASIIEPEPGHGVFLHVPIKLNINELHNLINSNPKIDLKLINTYNRSSYIKS